MLLQVTNSPFNQEQAELLNRLLPSLSESQQLWLSGYLSACNTQEAASAVGLQNPPGALQQTEATQATKELTILFGSQTGNSQGLAEEISEKLKSMEYKITLESMNDFKVKDLKKLTYLLIIVSTHGEGDPPDTALPLYEFLYSRRAPKLNDLHFSVLALGDSSYEFFCQTGKQFDARLEELGAKRLSPRVDCDLDYDEPATKWFEDVAKSLKKMDGDISSGPAGEGAFVSAVSSPIPDQPKYSRTNPFRAEILENINLNGRGSNKETRHLELSLEGSNFKFEPGDSIGIYPENDEELVNSIIEELQLDPSESVPINNQGEVRSLVEALKNHYEITVLSKQLLEKASEANEKLKEFIESGDHHKDYVKGRDLLDLVRDFSPWNISAGELVGKLRKLPARLYSIASSYQANPDEVHLTIGAVRYESHGRKRNGVCSVHCAERAEPGDALSVYVQSNANFKLPSDPDIPVIMIGPGTGVAPFRSFLEEKEEIEAKGKTWLFFGDQHFVTDFLYQVEWQRWLKNGVLTKMDVAFSRDTKEKVYVQHRMLDHSRELYDWLLEGAHVYICGDEKNMAKDVHATLLEILEKEGGMTSEEAVAYLAEMQQEKRYQRDVY
ncbi:assimilatory sulfite reductase (NADPH) flavoprotein subunit [Siminovitchia fortis]|uniref:assimilatory sulfite reductase (NADPH) n=1 Tax=Siminovitchia fortis TaxID=254758 RepID=A0A451GBU1_9BACI|nr:assimilatory sulfite reductase (NADPH) flavoprotein subunit [Siminovitchia fortis]RWR12538.1 assimilatory sulfite reductase (NADPH) flavoprotein subunit [Siminovitchia fortis]WHY81617.1 assimilatory sulfite reductase (NADPH) flavoprotein subunit [Siminovitchia fortis]